MRLIFAIIFLIPLVLFPQSSFEKAEKLFSQEKYTLAKPIFENILKENPNHLKTIEYLGDIEGIYKSWDKAMVYYDKLIKLKPLEANYYYKYGGCLGMKAKEVNKFVALGMISDVKEYFGKAITLNPKHIEARWALIQLYLELPGIVGGSERKAQNYANELMKISPVDGYLAKGHIAEYFDRYKEAEKQYQKAITVGGSKNTYQKLANLYKNKLNQPQKAKEVMDTFSRKE
jgi:tetratricopeptide (TPR) repeat protein